MTHPLCSTTLLGLHWMLWHRFWHFFFYHILTFFTISECDHLHYHMLILIIFTTYWFWSPSLPYHDQNFFICCVLIYMPILILFTTHQLWSSLPHTNSDHLYHTPILIFSTTHQFWSSLPYTKSDIFFYCILIVIF